MYLNTHYPAFEQPPRPRPPHNTDLSGLGDLNILQAAGDEVLVLVLGVDHHCGAELICDRLGAIPTVETRLDVKLT